ncbi:MAG: alpha/beta hydrolase [Lachnospiraceae bacterium]|nr:alpha/beta hydrolase [Lachnospiraceae bacterium]
MGNNLFIIHGYNGDTTETFGNYVKTESEKLGIQAYMPNFPIRQEATYENWSEVMDTYWQKGLINKNTIIVAHSLATHFVPKYIADRNIQIQLYISLAGFLNDNSGREDIRTVVERFKPADEEIEKAINLMENRYAIYSDNDHLNPKEELERYADKFKANKIFISGIGHMGRRAGVKQIPEIIEIIKKTNAMNT